MLFFGGMLQAFQPVSNSAAVESLKKENSSHEDLFMLGLIANSSFSRSSFQRTIIIQHAIISLEIASYNCSCEQQEIRIRKQAYPHKTE